MSWVHRVHMRPRKGMVCLVAIIGIAAGACDSTRYQLMKDKDGRTIRLDTQTGEVVVLERDRMVPIKTPREIEEEAAAEEARVRALANVRTWPVSEFKAIGVKQATLTTRWRNGVLWYHLQLQPVPRNYEKNPLGFVTTAPLTLVFYDDAGFEVLSIPLNRSALVHVSDEEGNVIGLDVNSAVQCSQQVYESIWAWSMRWNL